LSRLGVYIHYPWCRSLCSYCDFPVAIAKHEPPHDDYARAVIEELDARTALFDGRSLESIYLGGGTPSLWRVDAMASVIDAVRARFGSPREVTIEANPTDCTPARLQAWRAIGIDRVSIGVQSLDAQELVLLGRDHRMGDGRVAVAAAQAAGFTSVSADFIFGASGSSPELLDAPHLSIYELTIEPRTSLGRAIARGTRTATSEEELAALYTELHERLTARGYQHYEVSSYARAGHRAVHNSLYWDGGEFLGLGVGAASFRLRDGHGIREVNVRQAPRYLRGERVADVVTSPPDELARDRIWLAMRTRDGALLADLPARLADRLLAQELCEIDGPRLRPTLLGFLHNDRIARVVVDASIDRD
jgi:oxygen-independent coproporphyrinogen-3 oxidase